MKGEVAQSCLTHCDPMGYRVHEILQARILEWVALQCSPPGDLPNPGIKSRSPALQVDSLTAEPPGKFINTMNSHGTSNSNSTKILILVLSLPILVTPFSHRSSLPVTLYLHVSSVSLYDH